MKKRIFLPIIFILFNGIAFSQINNTLDGFLGINWESNMTSAEDIMLERGFQKETSTAPDVLNFIGTFAGKDNASVKLEFVDNKFWQARTSYNARDLAKMLLLHFEFSDMLEDRYGEPDTRNNVPGSGENALWNFSNNCGLSLAITTRNPTVTIIYINLSFRERAAEQNRRRAVSDL